MTLPTPPLRILELFAGLGGVACVCQSAELQAEIETAIDINQSAAAVYRQNFSHPYLIREIEALPQAQLAEIAADVWWLSPPCQPFTRRGQQRDLHDPRCRGLLHVIDALAICRPWGIGLENVCGFVGSQAQLRLLTQLDRLGYHVQSIELCPSQMGWPNRRPRYYLLAAQSALPHWRPLPQLDCQLAQLLDPALTAGSPGALPLQLATAERERFWPALDRIELQARSEAQATDTSPQLQQPADTAITACFASSYGRAIARAGSYVQCGTGLRRFSPREVARLLGFPDSYRLEGITPRVAWKLLGNSLSLPVVKYVLSHLVRA